MSAIVLCLITVVSFGVGFLMAFYLTTQDFLKRLKESESKFHAELEKELKKNRVWEDNYNDFKKRIDALPAADVDEFNKLWQDLRNKLQAP